MKRYFAADGKTIIEINQIDYDKSKAQFLKDIDSKIASVVSL
jgi:hypothetical protein